MVKKDTPADLQDCKAFLEKLSAEPDCAPFLEPVDWKGLGLTDYPKVVKRPMDLGTMRQKLNSGKYASAVDFVKDLKLIWRNCMTYNADGSSFYTLAEKFDKKTDREMNKIIKKHNLKGVTKSHSKAPSVEDKANFCKLMYEITEVQLGKIVQAIAEDCGDALDKTVSDEVEVNVDAIDGATFKKIDALIKGFAKEAKAEAKKGKNGTSPPPKKLKV